MVEISCYVDKINIGRKRTEIVPQTHLIIKWTLSIMLSITSKSKSTGHPSLIYSVFARSFSTTAFRLYSHFIPVLEVRPYFNLKSSSGI